MKKRSLFVSAFALCSLVGVNAMAQGEPPPPTPPLPPPAQPPPAPPQPPPAPPPAAQPTPPAPPAPPAAEAPKAEGHWYDKIKPEAFVDAYFSANFNFPRPQSPTAGVGGNQLRAFDVNNGASLHWVGANLSYAPDPIGGTVSLRFGPGARLYAGSDNAVGLENIKQAYASARPGGAAGKVQIDFGKFDQPFGSEVADSQSNMNYTRSVLYYAQPLFFTGFRLDWAPADAFDIKVFAVNGWNNTVDNNAGKSFGTQIMLKPADAFIAYLGYMIGPEQSDVSLLTCPPDTVISGSTCKASMGAPGGSAAVPVDGANSRLRQLIDAVIDINPTKDLRFLLNADYSSESVGVGAANTTVSWFGANLGIRYAFTDNFALAGRGGILLDRDGVVTASAKDTKVFDGTLTVAVTPTPNFLLKLDGRVDVADGELYQKSDADRSKTQFTTTLGVVATTN